MKRMPTPVEMGSVIDRTLTIVWSDGHRSTYAWRALRAGCPCARCKGEWDYRPAPLRAEDFPPALRAIRLERVGAYALRFGWTDGHDTGIYPFPLLRNELCECGDPAHAARRADRGAPPR
jgi:DUF971 family protein